MCDEAHRDFQRLLQVLSSEFVMMMEAYFDESGTHYGSPVMCVAGYLLESDQALRLDREWAETLGKFGVSCFHMVDYAHSRGEFENFSKQQRDDLIFRLIGIIKRRVTIGVAVSVSDSDFCQVVSPTWKQGDPYLIAALEVLNAVVSWADKRSYSGTISYFFEAGHDYQHQTNKAIEMLRAQGSEHLRYGSHTFGEKRRFRPLQAADILAYEWQKELRRLNGPTPESRTPRRSLQSLLETPTYQKHVGRRLLDLFMTDGYEAVERETHFTLVE